MSKNKDYWLKREQNHIELMKKNDRDMAKLMNDKLDIMQKNVEKEILANMERYTKGQNVDQKELFKRVSEMDVKAFEKRAKQLVKDKDFSDQANYDLKLYNLKMRMSRLEMIKSNVNLDIISGMNDIEKEMTDNARKLAYKELERQSGILGETVGKSFIKDINTLLNASLSTAKFSDSIWQYQTQLRNDVETLLTKFITTGVNPRVLAADLKKAFDVTKYQAERLMRTETAKIQGDMQIKMYQEFDITEYGIIAEPTACHKCTSLTDKTFKVGEELAGDNMVPLHPNCRCTSYPVTEANKNTPKAIAESIMNDSWFKEQESTLADLSNEISTTSNNLRAMRLKNQENPSPENEKMLADALVKYRNAVSKDFAFKNTYVKNNADRVIAELKKHRDFGIGELDIKNHITNGRAQMSKVLKEAYEQYPTDWIKRSADYGTITTKNVKRGYYMHSSDAELAISPGIGLRNPFRTAVHELSHRQEYVNPDILKAEKEFYEYRTKNEKLARLRDVTGIKYRKEEVTRVDNFIDPYMGKDYGGRAYELLSMGVETLYAEPLKLAKDPEMFEWIIKMLLTK